MFAKYICYLLEYALGEDRVKPYFFYMFFTQGIGSYAARSQCSPYISTIYLVCMTNQLNGVLWDGKACCKCLNQTAVQIINGLISVMSISIMLILPCYFWHWMAISYIKILKSSANFTNVFLRNLWKPTNDCSYFMTTSNVR